jgi:hypothetical protein
VGKKAWEGVVGNGGLRMLEVGEGVELGEGVTLWRVRIVGETELGTLLDHLR